MKSLELHEMDVVLAPTQPGSSAELVAGLDSLLGSDRCALLRHLMDGRPILVPGFLPGEGCVTGEERNPRVRFLTGRVHQVPDTGVWTGPVLLESAELRATYIAVESLAHRECSRCDPVWARAAAQPAGFWIEGFEIDPGVTAQIASQLGREHGTIESVNVRVDQGWVDWDREPDARGDPNVVLLTDPFEVL